MSEAKFTKKMEIGFPSDRAPFCVDGYCNIDGKRFEVCSVWGCDDDSELCEQSEANARLFSKAPDMYEMLERLANRDECQMHRKEINELLAEARGEL